LAEISETPPSQESDTKTDGDNARQKVG